MSNLSCIKTKNPNNTSLQKIKSSSEKLLNLDFFALLIKSLVIINILFFGITVFSLFINSAPESIISALKNGGIKSIEITMVSIFVTCILNIILGVPAAFLIARKKQLIYKAADIITIIPIAIPPLIAGLALLTAFGRKGFLSDILGFLEINIAFTFAAVVMAQIFVTLPIFIQIMKAGFKSIEKEIEEAALLEGAKDKDILFNIYMPLSKNFLIIGIILSLLRAAGEFGATIMFAGNLPGKTRTLTTAIYTLTEYKITEAISLAVVLVLLFLLPLLMMKTNCKGE